MTNSYYMILQNNVLSHLCSLIISVKSLVLWNITKQLYLQNWELWWWKSSSYTVHLDTVKTTILPLLLPNHTPALCLNKLWFPWHPATKLQLFLTSFCTCIYPYILSHIFFSSDCGVINHPNRLLLSPGEHETNPGI